MATSRVREPLNLYSRPAAVVKPMSRCTQVTGTTSRSVLSAVGNVHVDPTSRTKREEKAEDTKQGRVVKGVATKRTRNAVTANASVLSSVGNVDTTARVKRGEKGEDAKQGRAVKGVVTTKTRNGTKRVPKTTTMPQSRPLNRPTQPAVSKPDRMATHCPALSQVNNTKSTIAFKKACQIAAAITVVDPTKPLPPSYRVHGQHYVSTRSKKTSIASEAVTGHELKKATGGNVQKAAASVVGETNNPQPATEKTTDIEEKIEKLTLHKESDCRAENNDSGAAGRELVPYTPEAFIDLTDDPSMCGEYAGDIYVYHRQLEEEEHYLVYAKFMDHQEDITGQHRRVLIDWLAQVHYKYQLLQETMLLTVDILDRYLQIAVVSKAKLQLVGIASLFISSKLEEIYAPSIYELEHIAANTYTLPEILGMEKTILQELDYRLLKPYPLHFLRRFSRLSQTDTNVHHLAKYFIDLSLLECEGSALLPSKKAAASFIIATMNLYGTSPRNIWTGRLSVHTGYSLTQLSSTLKALLGLIQKKHPTDKATAIREKYIKHAPTEKVKEVLKGPGLALKKLSV